MSHEFLTKKKSVCNEIYVLLETVIFCAGLQEDIAMSEIEIETQKDIVKRIVKESRDLDDIVHEALPLMRVSCQSCPSFVLFSLRLFFLLPMICELSMCI